MKLAALPAGSSIAVVRRTEMFYSVECYPRIFTLWEADIVTHQQFVYRFGAAIYSRPEKRLKRTFFARGCRFRAKSNDKLANGTQSFWGACSQR